MKKILFSLLGVLLLTFFSAAVYAEDNTATYEQIGFTVTLPENVENAKGIVYPYLYGRMDTGLYLMGYIYFAMESETFNTLAGKTADELTEEEQQDLYARQCDLLYVAAINGGRGPAEILNLLGVQGLAEDELTRIGQAEDVTFYLLEFPGAAESFIAGIEPEFAQEYTAVHDSLTEALKNAEFFVPVDPEAALIGRTLNFETVDVDGNPVSSSDLFKDHQITMINVWATWCHFCLEEMEALGEMHRRLADKGAAVVGICTDADTKGDLCKEILEENHVDYINILPFEGMDNALPVSGYPTSFFVNSEGTIAALPFTGVPRSGDVAEYEEVIDRLLAEEAAKTETTPQAVENGESVYRVIVTDNEGSPIPGAVVQFCSDSMCMVGETDEEGTAVFENEEGVYTVHILTAPEEYEATEEEFETAETYSDVFIMLQKR